MSRSDDKSSTPSAKRRTSGQTTAPVTPSTGTPVTSRTVTGQPLAVRSGAGRPTTTRRSPGTGSSPGAGASGETLPLSTRAGLGLRRFVAAHRPTATRAASLDACTFGSVRGNSRAIDAAADGTSSAYRTAQAVVQRYQISTPNNGAVGDRGDAVSCFGTTARSTILGLSATTNAEPVPTGHIRGLQGPRSYRDGDTYSKIDNSTMCSVYWVPPRRDYDLVVVFRTKTHATTSQCRRGFTTVAPTILQRLAAFAR